MAVDTETLYPFSGVDTQRITEAGFEIPRQNGDSATLTFNEVSQEWKFNRGDLKLNSEPDEGTDTSQVLLRNSSTGKIEQISSDKLVDAGIDIIGGDDIDTSYNSSLDEYTIDLEDDIAVNSLTLDQNKTQDTSGDLQIRDDSSGDLFSLDGGNTPDIAARYEGSGAFTFGTRVGTVGSNSVVFNGVPGVSSSSNTASGSRSSAFGRETEASGVDSMAIGVNTEASGNQSISAGTDTIASGDSSAVFGDLSEATGDSSFAAGQNAKALAAKAAALGQSQATGTDSFSANESSASGDQAASLNQSSASGKAAFSANDSDSQGFGSATLNNSIATAKNSFAASNGNASGEESVAISNGSASGYRSIGGADNTDSSVNQAVSLGQDTVSRVVSSTAVGISNEDYLGPGNGLTDVDQLMAHDRIFSVGVGNPDATDHTNRLDGLFVTYRNGTHVRHGFSLDVYNDSIGMYETVFKIDEDGTIVKGSVSPSVSQTIDLGGPDEAIQYNDNGDFGGTSNFTWDGTGLNINKENAFTARYNTGINPTRNKITAIGAAADLYLQSNTTPSEHNNIVISGESDSVSFDSHENIIIGDYAGNKISTDNFENVIIGHEAARNALTSGVDGQNVVIGERALKNSQEVDFSIFLGNSAGRNFNQNGNVAKPWSLSAIGWGAFQDADMEQSIALGTWSGRGATGGSENILIGPFIAGAFTQNFSPSQITDPTGVMLFGTDVYPTKNYQLVFGSDPDVDVGPHQPLEEGYFGKGVEAHDPTTFRFRTTDTHPNESNVSGADLGITSGRGTGTGDPSEVFVETPDETASGTNLQSVVERLRIGGSGVRVKNTDLVQEGPELKSYFEGKMVQSSGSLIEEGDNGSVQYSLNQKTSGSVTKILKIDSQDLDSKPTVPDEGTWHFQGNVTARVVSANSSLSDSEKGDSHVWRIEGVVSQTVDNPSLGSTNVRFIGNPSVTTVANDISVNNYSVDIFITSDGELEIEVRGETGDDVHWVGNLEVDEIQG